ncbi:xylulokinase [Treponema sp.]
MRFILTFDVGTTSVKTRLFDESFQIVGSHSAEYQLIVKSGGIVEMEGEAYWSALCKGSRAVVAACPAARSGIEVIAISTQGETLIPIDSKGKPLCNAIVWLDSRSTEEAAFLRRSFGSDIYYPSTGLGQVDEVAPISKILNIKNKRPDVYSQTYKFLLLEDYLLLRLSGKIVTEKSLLSSSGYFNIRTDALYTEILDYAEISPSLFPEVLECAQAIGTIQNDAAYELGINAGARVVTGAMDQVSGAIGAGNIRQGIVTETTGTALVMGASTTNPDFSHPARPIIYRHALKGSFFVLSLSNTAGMIMKWFKDEFCALEAERFGDSVYAELDRLAAEIPPASDGLLVFPHFSGVITPVSDPDARGIFYGVTLNTRKAHFLRAIMESVAYMLKENIEIFEQMGISVQQIRSLGGGSRSGIWSQIKADVLQREILTFQDTESTSIGAAMLGALGAGWYPSLEAMGTPNPQRATFQPNNNNTIVYDAAYAKYQKLYQFYQHIR